MAGKSIKITQMIKRYQSCDGGNIFLSKTSAAPVKKEKKKEVSKRTN